MKLSYFSKPECRVGASRNLMLPWKSVFNMTYLCIYIQEKGRPLPKFGEWDVNDPASAEGFTAIFTTLRDEKKTGGKPDSPTKLDTNTNTSHGIEHVKTQGKKWFCCMQSSSTNY